MVKFLPIKIIMPWKLILILQILSLSSFSQNLILNGTFEDANTCTEYEINCSPEAWRTISSRNPGFYTSQKNNFASVIVFSKSRFPDTRTYLESRLADTLIIGEKYKFSMDIASDGFYINKIGVCFSDTLILTQSDILLNMTPDIEFVNNTTLLRGNKSKAWLHLEKEFIAEKKALFIIIGSFEPDDVRKVRNSRKISSKSISIDNVYFIDNIQLISNNKLYMFSDLESVKDVIYSQDDRHPIPDNFLEIPSIHVVQLQVSNTEKKSLTDTVRLLDDLLFEFNSYKPSLYLNQKVDSVFENIKYLIESIKVVGHTDNIGSEKYNDDLSIKRAESVANYIKSLKMIPDKNIAFYGMGSRHPIATNSNPEGRSKNRRVEIIIKYKAKINDN